MSTLTRLRNQKSPNIAALLALTRWLGMTIKDFVLEKPAVLSWRLSALAQIARYGGLRLDERSKGVSFRAALGGRHTLRFRFRFVADTMFSPARFSCSRPRTKCVSAVQTSRFCELADAGRQDREGATALITTADLSRGFKVPIDLRSTVPREHVAFPDGATQAEFRGHDYRIRPSRRVPCSAAMGCGARQLVEVEVRAQEVVAGKLPTASGPTLHTKYAGLTMPW